MELLVATLVVFTVTVFVMSAGVMLSGRRLKGSCGGVGTACPCSDAEQRSCARRVKGPTESSS